MDVFISPQRRYHVVIPSKDAGKLAQCVESVFDKQPDARVIVVDDGGEDKSICDYCFKTPGVDRLLGRKPFVFARNANLGIERAWSTWAAGSDVILMNDDATLGWDNGFENLALAVEAHPEYGVVSAAIDGFVGNPEQKWSDGNRRPVGGLDIRDTATKTLAFVCVYIPQKTIGTVGWLDERFTSYGFEDDDYCYRVRRAGLKLGIYHGCRVEHGKLRSEFRTYPDGSHRHQDLNVGKEIFKSIHGKYPEET